MTVDELIAKVYAAPRGPRIAACFDYDGTVIAGYSAVSFYNRRLKERDIGPTELARTTWSTLRGVRTEQDFAELLDLSLAAWAGKPERELIALGEHLFKHEIAARLHSEVWQLAEAHRAMGHTIVLASSATRFQVAPMARDLRADHVLCTTLEVRDGVVTGRVEGDPLWGLGKARAVRTLAESADLDLARSFGYSNGDEDLLFLESVGNPVAVQPQPGLAADAAQRGWPVLRCVERGGRPGVADLLRTAGFYGGFAAAAGAGLGIGLLNRSRRQAFELTSGIGCDVGLALAGIDVEVVSGAEYLWSARPCLFTINHQSKIDPFIAMKLLRGGFTGVAKKEAKNVPGFGQLFQLADVAFIDRGNTRQAREALAPAVAKLRDEGISLALAPEGTRSATPRLGPFKKGAFHIAMQAGVPIVPIVIRNAGEVMWRGAQVMRSGTVEVVVHPPVDTSGWRVETLGEHVEQFRDVYVRTLAEWPGRPTPARQGAEQPEPAQPRSAQPAQSAEPQPTSEKPAAKKPAPGQSAARKPATKRPPAKRAPRRSGGGTGT